MKRDNRELPNINPTQTKQVTLRALTHVMDVWHVSAQDQEALIGRDISLFDNQSTILSHSEKERISLILKIYKYLHSLFSSRVQANEWMLKPNAQFNGLSAIEYIKLNVDEGLLEVVNYLHTLLRGLSQGEQKAFVINSVIDWAGSEEQANQWYESTLISSLNMTAELAVENGHFDSVCKYLESIRLGGFA